MANNRDTFAPYTQITYDACRKICLEKSLEDVKIDSSSVGYALDQLRKLSLIWKSGRGVYAIEDTQHVAILSGISEEKLF